MWRSGRQATLTPTFQRRQPRRLRAFAVHEFSPSKRRQCFLPAHTYRRSYGQHRRRADVLATLDEGYLLAASRSPTLAVGDRNAEPVGVHVKCAHQSLQMRHFDGTPLANPRRRRARLTFTPTATNSFTESCWHARRPGSFLHVRRAASSKIDLSITAERASH